MKCISMIGFYYQNYLIISSMFRIKNVRNATVDKPNANQALLNPTPQNQILNNQINQSIPQNKPSVNINNQGKGLSNHRNGVAKERQVLKRQPIKLKANEGVHHNKLISDTHAKVGVNLNNLKPKNTVSIKRPAIKLVNKNERLPVAEESKIIDQPANKV